MQKLTDGARKLGIDLSTEQVERFETYYRELIRWNRQMNLTRITDYEEVQLHHFLDSLTAILGMNQGPGSLWCNHALRVLDVGTGAGFPGLPLKILRPSIPLTLLDSVRKKTEFLHHLIAELGLAEVEVVWGRAEELAHHPAHRGQFKLVLTRALAPLPTLVELTLPFCATGGRVVFFKKGDISQELQRAAKAITLLGGATPNLCPIPAEVLPDRRLLVTMDKIGATPPQYPRRPGIPAKRPLA